MVYIYNYLPLQQKRDGIDVAIGSIKTTSKNAPNEK
jgi:hypothetical protein